MAGSPGRKGCVRMEARGPCWWTHRLEAKGACRTGLQTRPDGSGATTIVDASRTCRWDKFDRRTLSDALSHFPNQIAKSAVRKKRGGRRFLHATASAKGV